MQTKLDVVFVTDINYIQHFTVALTSLLENNLNIIDRIFLLHDVDNITLFSKILDFFKHKYKKNIELKVIDSKQLDTYNLSHHLTKATYFRLFISDVIPNTVDKILFLDSDIIIRSSISELLNLDFKVNEFKDKEYYLYAVDHKYTEQQLVRLKNLEFTGTKYFNAGIILINLRKWRKDNVSRLFHHILEKYNDKILWADQDILNLAFDHQWEELNYEYNAFGLTSANNNNNYKIIHYTGSSKPWQFRNKHPYKKLYWKYLLMTPFKTYMPEDLTIINVIKWMIPNKIKEFIRRQK